MQSGFRHLIQRSLRSRGYELRRYAAASGAVHAPVEPYATYSPWNGDAAFADVHRRISANTLVDRLRCYELWQLVQQSAKLTGALLEVGVWRGGTGALIASAARRAGIRDTVYLCDTFSGVVKAGAEDSAYVGGEHADTSQELVQRLLDSMDLTNARLLRGVFPNDTGHLIPDAAFRFCHIDVDVYQSARECLDWLWGRLCVGGIVVYDDYGFEGCSGVTRHVDEQRSLPDRQVIHNLNGHAIVVKTR
jgi:O-methyltransferase